MKKRVLFLVAIVAIILAKMIVFALDALAGNMVNISCGKNTSPSVFLNDFFSNPPACLYAAEMKNGELPDKVVRVISIFFQPEIESANVNLADGRTLVFLWGVNAGKYQRKKIGDEVEVFYFPTASEGMTVGLFSRKNSTSWLINALHMLGSGYEGVAIRY